jgi:DNA-binding CsgD family transcriptional regulator
MPSLSRADLEGVLAFLGDAAEVDGPVPFPDPLLHRLADLFPGSAIVWSDVASGPCRAVEFGLSREPWWNHDALMRVKHLEPVRLKLGHEPAGLVMYSEMLTLAERRGRYWDEVIRPAGVRDKLQVRLDAPRGSFREINVDRFDREFSGRDREVLTVLRPHLNRLWENAHLRRAALATARHPNGLTRRQLEILRWVALGKSNIEIAGLLYLSPGTVRKHIDNIFADLGVHSRTAAATLVFGDGYGAPA